MSVGERVSLATGYDLSNRQVTHSNFSESLLEIRPSHNICTTLERLFVFQLFTTFAFCSWSLVSFRCSLLDITSFFIYLNSFIFCCSLGTLPFLCGPPSWHSARWGLQTPEIKPGHRALETSPNFSQTSLEVILSHSFSAFSKLPLPIFLTHTCFSNLLLHSHMSLKPLVQTYLVPISVAESTGAHYLCQIYLLSSFSRLDPKHVGIVGIPLRKAGGVKSLVRLVTRCNLTGCAQV